MTKERSEELEADQAGARAIVAIALAAATVALVTLGLAYTAWQNDLDRKAFLECVRTVEASPNKYTTVFNCSPR